MRIIKLPTNYYQQFDADYSLDVPAEGFGGWKNTELELDIDHTAVVHMHATDHGTFEQSPGLFRACEYIPRSYEIGKNVMPGILNAVRKSGMKLFHMGGGDFSNDYSGYKKALELGAESEKLEQIESDPVIERLRAFKSNYSFPGKHNDFSSKYGCRFPPEEEPKGDEYILKDEDQLFAVCKKYGINHLIYTGYNINWCILFAGGGIMYISRRGIMCSTIRQAVTAVENKETARNGLGKESALWLIAVGFGFVYDLNDFVSAISK